MRPVGVVARAEGDLRRWVLHVDLDQFIAAVEVLRHPELEGLPVVVGGRGDPTERGVVATASYAARAFGVGSGMPLRVAARKCPDAVFLPVDAPAYEEASQRVMDTLRGLTWSGRPVVVEVLGWDEAFLAAGEAAPTGEVGPAGGEAPAEGVGGGPPEQHRPLDPLDFAATIREEVLAATGLHCSVGIGDNKLRAKVATDFGKPRGSFVLTDENWFEVMGARPTEALWGIGRKTAKKLADLGIHTVRELADADARELAAALGPTMGPWYRRIGRGVDTGAVDATPYLPRAHGREETFQTDLESWPDVEAAIDRLARAVVADIDREGRPAQRVGIKVRYRPFVTVTRSLTLAEPTRDPDTLAAAATGLLDRVEHDRPVRLLGVRLEMTEPDGGYPR